MDNKAKKLKKILANDVYIIPRYQRNYAWGKAEISQLIKDIEEFFPVENNEDKSYYLGSLVCFKREDGSFELIDGQQRHTTITLINLVLKNWPIEIKNTVSVPNLKFDSRKKIQNYIESLYNTDTISFLKQANELNITGIGSFKDAIEIIQEELREIDVENFAKNFYNKVYLFRVEVPEETNLNHYFEIMNNRGEQLEKHEIVKALLMGEIKNDDEEVEKQEQDKFAKIWDACSEMSNYVYFNFDSANRKNNFPNEGELNANDFNGVSITENSNENQELSLLEIITKHNIPTDFPKDEKFIKDKYKSIIDFPNFLLQVLKIKNDKVSLDDKKLLEQFEEIKPDPKEFIFDLLKYRSLFDKFVIKQDLADADETKQNWGIRKLNTDFETTIKTFETDEELTKLQVMLYYSDTTNTYNNWLHEILKSTDFEIGEYTKKVWTIAKDKFKSDNLSYPTISIFNLYFIDFLLWKLYAENIKGKESFTDNNSDKLNDLKKKIFHQRGLFNTFKFKQLNSKEHLAAQSNPNSDSIHPDDLNGIGNLCLITTSQNSAGNKENPSDKKKRFHDDNSSLKRLIMFESYINDKWESDQIKNHKTEIENLIDEIVTN
ncbi:MAG: DUF262 domain-containing protein [Flavobacteriales bacterium]|nr:DUF262 domain-containing protein [Flavobacteriales bacterium]